jgi:shikimate kinase
MNDLLKGLNLYLVGMMGAGKTTVGRLLAASLGYGFLDSDEVITKAAGKTVNQIFTEDGEETFRQLESDVLGQICAFTRLTVATGGGIILKRENWSYLRQGLVVWLDVPVAELERRLQEDTTRPLLRNSSPRKGSFPGAVAPGNVPHEFRSDVLQNTELEEKLMSLMETRYQLYSQCDLKITIEAGETPAEIAQRIIQDIPSVLKDPDSN